MGRGFEFFTIGMTAAIGVGTSYYVLNPYLKEQQIHKQEEQFRMGGDRPMDLLNSVKPDQMPNTTGFAPEVGSGNDPESSAETEREPTTTWDAIRQFGAKTFEPGDLRRQWSKQANGDDKQH